MVKTRPIRTGRSFVDLVAMRGGGGYGGLSGLEGDPPDLSSVWVNGEPIHLPVQSYLTVSESWEMPPPPCPPLLLTPPINTPDPLKVL